MGIGHLPRWKVVCSLRALYSRRTWSFLPYVEIVTQREYSYKCVMINERILGLKVRFEYSWQGARSMTKERQGTYEKSPDRS